MDRLTVEPVSPDISSIKFNPMWRHCIGEIILYVPKVRVGQNVVKNQVLASLETSRMITTIRAPCAAKVLEVNRDFLDNPCDLSEERILFTFGNMKP
ncbi:MAG: hypothetical protein NUV80_06595 [Candidatus Berkelbacteria bacterium]|nr:hypothetical protein [Candidatus Berkelbacteria bacterium]